MGVRGLTTYINTNQDIFMKKFYIYNTKLIIDGLSLTSQLYRSLNCFSAFGGDYDKYADFVRKFFKNLKRCNVEPYVIFDGSYERKKIKTVFSRLRSKLKNASRLDPVTQDSLQIFPLLLRDVFRDVLAEMDVPYMICEFEADDEIASLARHLNCPVLSYDSDFFIYNVLYIPFNTLEIKSKPINIEGESKHCMKCKIFKVQNLTEHFEIKDDVLPLLAILLGNDYIEKRVFQKFFSQLKLKKFKKRNNSQQRSIHTLFQWLQNETLETAIVKILGRVKNNEKKKVLQIIRKGIEGYNRKKCQSLSYFNVSSDKNESNEYDDIEMKIEKILNLEATSVGDSNENCEDCESSTEEGTEDEEDDNDVDQLVQENTESNADTILPEWFHSKVQNNLIPFSFLNLYTNHIYFCSPQADDYSDDDPFICTLPILRYAFDLLTDSEYDYCVYIGREKCMYKKMFIETDMSIESFADKKFCNLTLEELHQCFYHFLRTKMPKLDTAMISLLPASFQLFMISMLWWISTCNVPNTHVHSLLVSYMILEVIDEKTGGARGHFLFNSKHAKKLEQLRSELPSDLVMDELFLNKNKVQYDDCLLAASILLKHFEIDDSIRKKPKTYDVQRIHSFAQFQCCLLQFNSLNTLCGLPYEKTVYHKCYNGTLIYNLALKMEKQTDPELFITQYLIGASSLLLYYKSMCSILNSLLDKICIKPIVKMPKKKKRVQKKVDEIEELLKGLEIDVL
ncbi:protein asteroid [Aricia agestis]|uniref:protein asteroid n=1 Tax=Aricia agestis TaxID=91739 RepID=UPI001C2087AA|nr:protein asteroid [Aricia agestis]